MAKVTAFRLLKTVPAVAPVTTNNKIYELFAVNPALESVVVIDNDKPVGLLTRTNIIARFARPYERELYGKKPCTFFMDDKPLIIDKDTSLQNLGQTIVDVERHHLFNGFIITDQGKYLGMGTGHDLVREITKMQISAARYANSLTLLPGNVPIDDHVGSLLQGDERFQACYVDLDNFKPYNDVYGYRRGDDVIQLVGSILVANSDPERDFVGHIGGDDFIVLFQSEQWQKYCQAILDDFEQKIPALHLPEHLEAGGYFSEDRRGQQIFHPLISISLGVIEVDPGRYDSHHAVAAAAAEAKRQAKKTPGNSLFIERRQI